MMFWEFVSDHDISSFWIVNLELLEAPRRSSRALPTFCILPLLGANQTNNGNIVLFIVDKKCR